MFFRNAGTNGKQVLPMTESATAHLTERLYPEGCESSGVECLACVQRTAAAMRSLTGNPTAEWAGAVFHRMYSYGACREMEHTFVWACGVADPGSGLVQIETAAA